MILNGPSYDFCGGSRAPVDQDNQGIFFAAIAATCGITLLRRVATVMRNNQLTLMQEFVGYANAFAEQAYVI